MTPLARGTAVALAAAVLFGATTPLVQRFGEGAGAFTTAALLYGGAAVFAMLLRARAGGEAPLRRRHLARLAVVALFGAVLAPAALAWGLQRANGMAASLLLNAEAAFTIVLGALLYKEHVGRRVALAATLMAIGGGVLVVARGGSTTGETGVTGLVAVGLATLGWALDNALGRPLAQVDPAAVVAGKGALGTALSLFLARVILHEPMPRSTWAIVGLFVCGASGYGASLALYLRAQRALGAGRTASVFAAAPFVGALLAGLLGQPFGVAVFAAGALFAAGAWLHATESHAHRHRHDPLEHEHAHRHDDGHHEHVHDPMPEGEHSHVHRHEPVEHEHAHAPDEHHQHEHT